MFGALFEMGRDRKWKFNHTPLYLDFLAGRRDYECTPWGNPTRNIFGWQRPCYLLAEGYASSFAQLAAALRLATRLDHSETALQIAFDVAPPELAVAAWLINLNSLPSASVP